MVETFYEAVVGAIEQRLCAKPAGIDGIDRNLGGIQQIGCFPYALGVSNGRVVALKTSKLE